MSLKLDSSFESNSTMSALSPMNKNNLLSPLNKKMMSGKIFKRMWSNLSINSDDEDIEPEVVSPSRFGSTKQSLKLSELLTEDDDEDDYTLDKIQISPLSPLPYKFYSAFSNNLSSNASSNASSSQGSPNKPENFDGENYIYRHRNSIPKSPTDSLMQSPSFFLRRNSDAQRSLNSISE